ncbi:PAS domain S-box-containing protein [Gramella sp. Hel_I_59]|uniref:PAS domain-containing hybrid sensor histidine kinase/response regulator n=1 Tax=Gramella sp. Hel_I_59 TaxID=1249978 RepID=UPI0011530CB6|nr:PAS domain-containing hybrid sensor histidine kinase/response regulator [Gramella sp. Hel_I_59]TQI71337.1 PAS domain S-box-containing protein [Gramella sp. Hel_I_59]
MEDGSENKPEIFESAEDLYHDAPCGYVSFRNDGTIYNINKTLLGWLDFDKNEILGTKKIYELFKMGGRMYFETHFFPLIRIQGFANEINFEIRKNDGSTFPALINVKELKGPTIRENRYRASVYDISDRKKYEQELMNAKLKAEKQAQVKAEFLATISHEIRTPLNAIVGIGDLLTKTSLNPKQKEYADILRLSSGNLLGLVNNILDLSKLEAKAVQLEKKPFAIRTLTNSLIHTFKLKCNEKGVELISEIDEEIPNYIVGDPIKLSQVLTNLLGNAIKFTCDGHVKLVVKLNASSSEKLDLNFSVLDTGTGIPADKLQSVFEEFSQASYEVNLEYGGTGLGLTISQQLLKLHGSEIKVASVLGEGSEFSFDITYEKYTNSFMEIDGDDSFQRKKLDQAKLLIVEDNPVNIFVISEYLKEWKINFDVAKNGKKAIEAAKKKNYDVILMDLHMPVINGFEATSTIRNLSLEKQPVILALSATSREAIQSELDRAGIDDFISKPFGPADLHKLISNYIVTTSENEKVSEPFKDKLGIITSEEHKEASQKSIDLSRFVKMANNKPEFLQKFIANTLIAFQDYLEDFQKAADLRDATQISELIHKSTMSVYYIQSDKLVQLLRDCQSFFEEKNANSEEIEAVIDHATAEFHQVIISLKNSDEAALMTESQSVVN